MGNIKIVESVNHPAITINLSAYETMILESSRFFFKETGGILLGSQERGILVITHASGPGPKAKHGYKNFRRDPEYCQEFLNQLYYESSGKISYVGEWHKHYWQPQPSLVDNKSMFEISKTSECRLSDPLLLIINKQYHSLMPYLYIYKNDTIFKVSFNFV